MSRSKRRRLENTVAAVQRQYGPQALRKGSTLPEQPLPGFIATSFPQLDAITGCRGIPLGHLTLFTGPLGSGKLTVAYKTLMEAQRSSTRQKSAAVAILSLNQQVHIDYLHRCQVDMEALDVYQPSHLEQGVNLLLDLVAGHYYRLIVVDSLSDLIAVPQLARQLQGTLTKLTRLLRATSTGLIAIGEQTAPWILRFLNWDQLAPTRQAAALHIDFTIHAWLQHQGQWRGYRRTATVRKSRWGAPGKATLLDIEFNGTVKARSPW